MVLGDVSYILLLACAINLILLLSNIFCPIPFIIKKNVDKKIKINKISGIYSLFFVLCALIITLPNSFGYLLNSYLRDEYSLNLSKATFYASIAVFIGSCVSEMFGFFVVDSLIRKLSPLKVAALGFIFSGVRWLFVLLSTSEVMFIATYLFHGISFAFIFIGSVHFISGISGNNEIGELSMRFTFFANVMGIILAQFYSLVLPYIGTQGIIWVFILICITSLPLLILIVRRQRDEVLSN